MTLISKFNAGEPAPVYINEKFPFQYLILVRESFSEKDFFDEPKPISSILHKYNFHVAVSNMSIYENFFVDREINSSEINEIKSEGHQIYGRL